MTVPQILFVLALVVVTGVVAWLLGRRSAPAPSVAMPAVPEPKPVAISDPEIQLHERLAQAVAEMVVPLETYFSRGVELNLTTASLTKDLLEKFPPKEAQVLLAMHSGLDREGLDKLSAESGLSLSEMEALRRKFQVSAATALLPKIKAGLSTAPPTMVRQGESPARPSNLTERLTLSTESNEIAHLKKVLNEAREEKEAIVNSHVPKTRLDSLQEEHRKNEEHLAQSIAGLKNELETAKSQISEHPAEELDELRAKVQSQQTLASELEATVAELQTSLLNAQTGAEEALAWKEQISQLQQDKQELASQMAARADFISKSELTTLQQAWEQQKEALESEVQHKGEQLEELNRQMAAAEANHAAAQGSTEMEQLRAQFDRDLAAKQVELERISAERAGLESKLAQMAETHVSRGEFAALQESLDSANEEQSSLRDALASLEKAATYEASQKAALEEQLAGISDKYVELAEWERLQSVLQQAQEEHAHTRARMHEELEKAVEQVAEKSRLCDEFDLKLKAVADDAISPAELEEAKAQIHQAEEEKRQLRAELEAKLAATQHLADEMQAGKNSLAERLAEMESTHRPAEEVESLRSQQAELNQRCHDLESALEGERAALQVALSRHGELQSEHRALSEQLTATLAAPPVTTVSESQEEMAVELKIARESQVRLVAELEALREAYAAIPTDQHEVAQRLATAEQEAIKSQEAAKIAQLAAEAAQKLQKETEAEMLSLRQATIPRGDYEALRLEADKARQDLSTTLGRYATLQRRFDSVDKAASIERLKASLSQEEKAHGVLRIQYRNLETRLYEAVGARKRVETDIKVISKERDEIASKLKSIEKSALARVKVTLPPEVANPPLDGEISSDEPAPKRRASRKKAQETVEASVDEASTEAISIPEPEV